MRDLSQCAGEKLADFVLAINHLGAIREFESVACATPPQFLCFDSGEAVIRKIEYLE